MTKACQTIVVLSWHKIIPGLQCHTDL